MSRSLPGEKESNYIESEIEGRLTIKLSRQPVRRLAGLARFLRLARSVTKGMVGFSALLGGPGYSSNVRIRCAACSGSGVLDPCGRCSPEAGCAPSSGSSTSFSYYVKDVCGRRHETPAVVVLSRDLLIQ